MPNILINELSLVGQADHHATADEFMRLLAETYRELEPMLCGGQLYRHSTLGQCLLCPDLSVYEWLRRPQKGEMRAIRNVIQEFLTKRPRIDTLLAEAAPDHICRCIVNDITVECPFSSLAGAAHLAGWLLSLRGCTDFPPGSVEIHYCKEGNQPQALDLQHFIEVAEAQAICRRYESNPKHEDFSTYGIRGTRMDLKPAEAQRILNCGVQFAGDKRVFAYHNNRIYVFNPHRAEANLFHGYPVEPQELRQRQVDIYNQLRALGWVS
jgi:hypothetical protein